MDYDDPQLAIYAQLDREEYMEKTEDDEDNSQWLQDQTPQQKKPDSMFNLFRDSWKSKDSTKLANLNSQELGSISISVRGCQHLASLGNTFGHPKFAAFFKYQGEITCASSHAKKGWFQELFVTNKKYSQRMSGSTSPSNPQSSWSIKSLLPDNKPVTESTPAQ